MANITLITQWFPPEPAYLWEDLALGLQTYGHTITVITGFPSYPRGKIYDDYKQSLFMTENVGGVKVIRLPIYPSQSLSIIKRGASYISFSLSVMTIGFVKLGKPDLILCYSPPLTTCVAAALLSKIKRVPFVMNIQDMWPDSLISSGMVTEGFVTKLINRTAKWLYKNSSGIVVLSDGFSTHLENQGVNQKKLHVISNWGFDQVGSPSLAMASQIWQKKLGIEKNDFIIMFAGNIGPAQALDVIVAAAEMIKTYTNIKILFVGDGVSLESLKRITAKKRLKNIIFSGRISYKEMPKIYSLADVLLIHLKKDPLFEITIPHKLLTYLSLGKPIISAVTGEVNSIVKKASVGFVCDSGDSYQISQLMVRASKLSEAERENIRIKSEYFYSSNFTKKILIRKWESVVSSILTDTTDIS